MMCVWKQIWLETKYELIWTVNKLMYSKLQQKLFKPFDAAKVCNFTTHLKVLVFDWRRVSNKDLHESRAFVSNVYAVNLLFLIQLEKQETHRG